MSWHEPPHYHRKSKQADASHRGACSIHCRCHVPSYNPFHAGTLLFLPFVFFN
jgi:hypothetical protein